MSFRNNYSLDIWIGLAKVKSQKEGIGILNGSRNAYVNVLGLANTKTRFKQIVKDAFNQVDLELLRIEDVEMLINRTEKFNIDKKLQEKARELLKGNDRVAFSTFHTYD